MVTEREEEFRRAIAEQIRVYCCIVDDRTLLTFVGAIAAQLAVRHPQLETPAGAVRDMLERGAFDVDDWPSDRRALENARRVIGLRFVGAGLTFAARDASRN